MSDDDLASPLLLVATSWSLESAEFLPGLTRFLRGTQASVRLQARRGARDQGTGTRRRLRVPCSSVYALPSYRRSGMIRTKPLALSPRFSHRPLSDLLFVPRAHHTRGY